ncbi:MAG: hypothetical protein JSU85_04955 [Candidatus Zixiibacteriota bacterium]|nr:MAG: hypothetical protein JSU85_04955 [candidate division Zixibacteria bacterium]
MWCLTIILSISTKAAKLDTSRKQGGQSCRQPIIIKEGDISIPKRDKRKNPDVPMPAHISAMLHNLATGKLHCPLCSEMTGLGTGEVQENKYIKAYVVKCAKASCKEVILAIVTERKKYAEKAYDTNR